MITQNILLKYINNDFNKLKNKQSHIALHNEPEKNALDRILKNETDASSVFNTNNKETIDKLIKATILVNIDEITNWINDKNDTSKTKHITYEINKNIKNDDDMQTIGHGFVKEKPSGFIKEYSTNKVRVVLKKDKNTDLGFFILTSYPDILEKSEDLIPTMRNVSKLVKETDSYKKSKNIVKKAYYEYITNPKNTSKATLDEKNSVMFIDLVAEEEYVKHSFRLTKDDFSFMSKKYKNGKITPINTKYVEMRNKNNPNKTYGNTSVKFNHNKNDKYDITKEMQNECPQGYKDIMAARKNIIRLKNENDKEKNINIKTIESLYSESPNNKNNEFSK